MPETTKGPGFHPGLSFYMVHQAPFEPIGNVPVFKGFGLLLFSKGYTRGYTALVAGVIPRTRMINVGYAKMLSVADEWHNREPENAKDQSRS
ncbi:MULTISPECIES: hypothetical protein [unclassified Pseudomonas]|uniref:hypothetical protein n=1 Tax=unclassified Pseudomonas TaxID=196821 RepID=UPI0013571D1B|nr:MULTISPECIES: hypothetical protein [unclassified Pseudomonas]